MPYATHAEYVAAVAEMSLITRELAALDDGGSGELPPAIIALTERFTAASAVCDSWFARPIAVDVAERMALAAEAE